MSNARTRATGDVEFARARPPGLPTDLVARDRIVQQLQAARPGSLVVVSAPAGWGKTIAVSQWARSRAEPVVWVDCTRTPQDPDGFWRTIRDSLHREIGSHSPTRPRPAFTAGMARAQHALDPLLRATADVALVLDDFHLVTDPTVRDEMNALAAQLPGSLTLVLSTRADPLVALHRARVSGEVVEVRARDLAFTPYETHRLLAEHHVDLSSTDVERLCDRMEGWAAGLRLAVTAFDSSPETTAVVDAIVRAGPSVAGYLLEQVLDLLDPDDRALLTKLSVVDRFDRSLAETLAETNLTHSQLERLANGGGFVTEDVAERFPFHLHGPLRTVLRDDLRGSDVATYRLLNGRAAVWYESAHLIEPAIDSALEAHEWDLAANLLIDLATLGIASGRPAMVAGQLERFSGAWETIDPRIVLVDVMVSLSRGDADGGAVRLAMVADAVRRLTGTSLVRAELLMRLLSAWIEQFRGDPERVLAALGPDDDFVAVDRQQATPVDDARRAIAQSYRAYAELSLGNLAIAEHTAAASMRTARDRYDVVQLRGRQLTAAVAAARGDIGTALSQSRDIVRLAAECGPQLAFDTSMAHAVAAWALLEQGDPVGAQAELEHAQGAGPTRHFSPPTGYLTDGIRARLRAASGERPDEVLDALRNVTEGRPNAHYPYLYRVVRLATTVHALLAMGRHQDALDVIDSGPISEHSANADLARATVLARAAIYESSAPDADALREVRERVASVEDHPPEDAYAGWTVRLLLAAAVVETRADDIDRATRLLHLALAETQRHGWRLPFLELGETIESLLGHERLRISTYNGLVTDLLSDIRPRTEVGSAELVVALSKREIEILRVLPSGYDQDELAQHLFISKNTLKTHLRAIYRKLGVESRRQAVIKGERLRLL